MPDSRYAGDALAVLRERGHRITRPRRLVVGVLGQQDHPLSPYDIHDLLAERNEKIDTVTIYRILDRLEAYGLAHRLAHTGGFLRCRLQEHDACHHHVICRDCGAIEEIHCPGMTAVERAAASESHYRIDSHYVEFLGLCTACK
jgi:Fe2+ or Zn2+ uptake regulation protein